MENMEQAINGVLNNPDMMQKIMEMAQALNGPGPDLNQENQDNPPEEIPSDMSNLAGLSGLLGNAQIDSDQQNLLKALGPYMSGFKITKLRKAMQAAKLAELAGTVLGNHNLTGR